VTARDRGGDGQLTALGRRKSPHSRRTARQRRNASGVPSPATRCGQDRPVGGGADRREGIIETRNVAPIKSWVGIEDLQSAHQQYSHADHIDPMCHSHPEAVTVDAAVVCHR